MIFEKASFEPNDFKSAVVDSKTLYIYLHSMKEPLHMDFKSGADAQAALIRLDAEVAANRTVKSDSTGRGNTVETKPGLFACFDKLVQKGKEKVQNVVDGTSVEALIFQMAADQAASTVKAKAEELSQKLEDVLGTVTAAAVLKKGELESEFKEEFNDLKEVIREMQRGFAETEVPDDAANDKPQEDEGTKTKGTGWSRHMTSKKSIFNGDTFSGASQHEPEEESIRPGSVGSEDEPLIGDLTSPELKDLIAEFVDGAMANPKTQEVFGNIYEIFGKEEAGLAVENLKKIIYEMAVNNPHAKLSDVLKRFLG